MSQKGAKVDPKVSRKVRPKASGTTSGKRGLRISGNQCARRIRSSDFFIKTPDFKIKIRIENGNPDFIYFIKRIILKTIFTYNKT